LTDEKREEIKTAISEAPQARWTSVLEHLGIAMSSWYRVRPEGYAPRKPGRPSRPLDPQVEAWVVAMATANPWYGYKRIAVMCRRAGQAVKNRQAYVMMKAHGLLHKRQPRKAELYQAARLFELLPSGPNDLWQMDVTYIHIPGFGWWYAVSVIDYYSRYCLALHLTRPTRSSTLRRPSRCHGRKNHPGEFSGDRRLKQNPSKKFHWICEPRQ
jgi:transposase InsO family protein